MVKSELLKNAIADTLARNASAGAPSYRERINANSISLILNRHACAMLDIKGADGKIARQFSLRADTRKEADALRSALENEGVVFGGRAN